MEKVKKGISILLALVMTFSLSSGFVIFAASDDISMMNSQFSQAKLQALFLQSFA